jgi:hypothetical protein
LEINTLFGSTPYKPYTAFFLHKKNPLKIEDNSFAGRVERCWNFFKAKNNLDKKKAVVVLVNFMAFWYIC